MDFLIELLAELILEGSLEIGTNRKVALPWRILALVVLLAAFGGVFALLLWLGILLMRDNAAAGWLVIALDAVLVCGAVRMFRKKIRERDAQ